MPGVVLQALLREDEGMARLGFTVTVRMIYVFGLCRNIEAIYTNKAGNNVYNAFQRICKNGD